MAEKICEVMDLVGMLALELNVAPLNKYPACWEYQIDDRYWIAANAHKETKECSKGIEVKSYHCYVEYNGFPFAFFNPFAGTIGHGAVANEDDFCDALKRKITELKEDKK